MIKLTFLVSCLRVKHLWLMGRMVRIVAGLVLIHNSVSRSRLYILRIKKTKKHGLFEIKKILLCSIMKINHVKIAQLNCDLFLEHKVVQLAGGDNKVFISNC